MDILSIHEFKKLIQPNCICPLDSGKDGGGVLIDFFQRLCDCTRSRVAPFNQNQKYQQSRKNQTPNYTPITTIPDRRTEVLPDDIFYIVFEKSSVAQRQALRRLSKAMKDIINSINVKDPDKDIFELLFREDKYNLKGIRLQTYDGYYWLVRNNENIYYYDNDSNMTRSSFIPSDKYDARKINKEDLEKLKDEFIRKSIIYIDFVIKNPNKNPAETEEIDIGLYNYSSISGSTNFKMSRYAHDKYTNFFEESDKLFKITPAGVTQPEQKINQEPIQQPTSQDMRFAEEKHSKILNARLIVENKLLIEEEKIKNIKDKLYEYINDREKILIENAVIQLMKVLLTVKTTYRTDKLNNLIKFNIYASILIPYLSQDLSLLTFVYMPAIINEHLIKLELNTRQLNSYNFKYCEILHSLINELLILKGLKKRAGGSHKKMKKIDKTINGKQVYIAYPSRKQYVKINKKYIDLKTFHKIKKSKKT